MKTLRCAIYTRKSSEEGLEQNFNSLHAQRESCAAYILSQAGEGWSEIPTVYDDGGFSGGSMERPGLRALLADISRGLIDVVVVYKVDRLTRSLADFARIVELFDSKSISFVSITQAFNTTTSMGRLTLNVLLSFAQFEREVTGERIRDKIAASKRKGMWMGGRPPLGYDAVEQRLVINTDEAVTVRRMFQRYLELRSVPRLTEELAATGVHSKQWVGRTGERMGGGVLGRGAVYHLLANPVYRGGIRHGAIVYPDAHPPIIDVDVWEEAQALLSGNAPDLPGAPLKSVPPLLKGLLFDPRSVPMTAIHGNRRGVRYRYYVSQDQRTSMATNRTRLSRIGMGVMDTFALTEVMSRLQADFLPYAAPEERLRAAVIRIRITEEAVMFQIRSAAVSSACAHLPGEVTPVDGGVEVTLPISLKHRQGATIIDGPGGAGAAGKVDRALVRGLSIARLWADRLATKEATSLKAIAASEGYCKNYAARLMPLAWLAPDLVEQILTGRQPAAVSLGALTRAPLPMDWDAQRQLFQQIGRSAEAL